MSIPLGGYRPGNGPLHRLGPGAKIVGLIAFAAVVIALRGAFGGAVGAAVAVAMLGLGVAFALLAGLGARDLLRLARGFAIVAVLLFAFQSWQNGWLHAVEVVAALFALIITATAFTASTSVDEMLDAITRALGVFRRFGAEPELLALAFSLVITSVPTVMGIAGETRSAARSRGLDRDPRALLVPFALRTVSHAQLTGEALAARGIGDGEALAARGIGDGSPRDE